MSGIRPNRTVQAGLLMSVDRGRPEVSAIRSNRRDQPLTDLSTPPRLDLGASRWNQCIDFHCFWENYPTSDWGEPRIGSVLANVQALGWLSDNPLRSFAALWLLTVSVAESSMSRSNFSAEGGTLAIFIPTNSGWIIAADKRQSPQGVFCDGINKILMPERPPRTAIVITGYISLRDTANVPPADCANFSRARPHPSILVEPLWSS
jgi:hypothetical protein